MIKETLLQERKATAKLSKTNNGSLQNSTAMNGVGTGANVGNNNTAGGNNNGMGISVKNNVVMSKGSMMYRQRGDSQDGPLPSLSGDPPVL